MLILFLLFLSFLFGKILCNFLSLITRRVLIDISPLWALCFPLENVIQQISINMWDIALHIWEVCTKKTWTYNSGVYQHVNIKKKNHQRVRRLANLHRFTEWKYIFYSLTFFHWHTSLHSKVEWSVIFLTILSQQASRKNMSIISDSTWAVQILVLKGHLQCPYCLS